MGTNAKNPCALHLRGKYPCRDLIGYITCPTEGIDTVLSLTVYATQWPAAPVVGASAAASASQLQLHSAQIPPSPVLPTGSQAYWESTLKCSFVIIWGTPKTTLLQGRSIQGELNFQ